MNWKRGAGLALLVGVVFALGLSRYGAARWQDGTDQLRARLESTRRPPQPALVTLARELQGLPAPVQRYFRTALTDGQPMIAAVSVEHRGTFALAPDAWKPFASTQRVVVQRPGFDWDASIRMLPGVPVRVHDAYVAGEGLLHAAVLGLVTVQKLHGTGEIARGELMRYLAEAAWYPTALLPSQGVRWEAVDGRSARATLTDGAVTLTMTFGFGADGLIETVRAEDRGRTVDGRVVPTPWQGRFWQYEARVGMRVPVQGEVAWLLPEGPAPYWRGTIAAATYELAR